MKKDLKSFMKGKGKEDVPPDVKQDIENQGKSEDELMRELSKEIAKGKQEGSFTKESADNFVKTVSPMLNSAQKKKLDAIMRQMKADK